MNIANRIKTLENSVKSDDTEPAILKELDQTDPAKAAYIRRILVEKRMDKKPYVDKIVGLWAKYLKRRGEVQ